jgi:hypothetical protein
MLFRWKPVPGTITPDPDPLDAVNEAALPLASTAEMCVVPGAPTGSGLPASRASIRATAPSMSERRRLASPPRYRSLRKLPPRARVCSRITSASRMIDSAEPGGPPAPSRERSRSP